MKYRSLFIIALLITRAATARAAEDAASKLDMHRILEVTGGKGQFDEKEGTFKVSMPRTDLSVTVAGVRVTPPLGLTSWAAFKPAGEKTMVMGDMVVTEDQVSPVMDAALEGGLEVTALQNHFLWDSPKVMFMHIGGIGTEEDLARAVARVFGKIRDTSGGKVTRPSARIDPAKTTLDPKRIEAILGVPGEIRDGVYKVVVGREASMHGRLVANTMGVNTWAAFAGSDEQAVVDGDFAMLDDEVQPVLKRLRSAGIHVVALHNHMIEESPRIFFLHYWGIGPTKSLAKGLKEALDVAAGPSADSRANASRKVVVDFESGEPGKLPAGFTPDLTGKGNAGSWTVVEDETAPRGAKTLAQVGDDPAKGRFPLCVYEDLSAKDVAVSVKLRPMSGEVDQVGGIVSRYHDRDNYYVVRANALEDNVVLYKVENGKRTDLKPIGARLLAHGKKVDVPAGDWSELRVVAKGAEHSVYFNGEHLFDVEDDTFSGPGRVGLWTKADSVTRFDELLIESLDGDSESRRP